MLNSSASIATALKAAVTVGVTGFFYLQPYRPLMFVGRSMEPTYHNHSVALTEPVNVDDLKKGDVVVINMADGPIIKRIAFVPGDRIPQVKFDGQWVDMLDVHNHGAARSAVLHVRQYQVPSGMVYVLGDNRTVSCDSRTFGCVSTGLITRKLVDQRPIDPAAMNSPILGD